MRVDVIQGLLFLLEISKYLCVCVLVKCQGSRYLLYLCQQPIDSFIVSEAETVSILDGESRYLIGKSVFRGFSKSPPRHVYAVC